MTTTQADQRLREAIARARLDDIAAALDEGASSSDLLNAAGIAALNRGDPALARRCFVGAITADPKSEALWLNRATADRRLGDDESERASLNGAIAVDRRSIVAWLRLAQLLERRGEDAEAFKAWSAMISLKAQLVTPNSALDEAAAHGADFVLRHQRKLGAEINRALGAIGYRGDRRENRLRAGVDAMLGIRKIYNNECMGFHFPFLPAEEFFERERFPWMAELEANTAVIREEFLALASEAERPFRPYVQQEEGTPENKWTPLDKSPDWSAGFLLEYGRPNHQVRDRCPRTSAILESLPLAHIEGRGPTAFFSVLRAGASIPPHTGVTNVRAIVHLPLVVPEGCVFRVGGETRPWREGEAFAFDDTIEHEAQNPTPFDRAVLIFDVWNPWLEPHEISGLQAMFAAIGPT